VSTPWVCVDFGSTYTKVAAVEPGTGRLLGTAAHRTTVDTDVLDGLDAALAQLSDAGGVHLTSNEPRDHLLACSSAGGGLRLAVVGYERVVTAEAGYRVGLSAGARVAHVTAGSLDAADVAALRDDRPDVVLLVGGTDGGNADVLLHNAQALADGDLQVPVVVAGNRDVRDEVEDLLQAAGGSVTSTDNVLPRIGALDPLPARTAIRDVFIRHVIGGKHLSTRADLTTFVRAATPDAVLAGVELLADGVGGQPGVGDVVVVDVGGATTDVYSVLTPDTEAPEFGTDVVETLWRSRSVEGDLGVRWNANGIVAAAESERLIDDAEAAALAIAAQVRIDDPAYLADDDDQRAVDRRLVELAATVALRRHARPQQSGEVRTSGKDLRRVRLVVGSGGVLRHCASNEADAVLAAAVADPAGGWKTPERARRAIDRSYVLAAAGLLGAVDPQAAAGLLRGSLAP
jgi:uncharacterized protein (TIGR01319 family)